MSLSVENWITIVFYATVIALIVIFRKRFEFQGKIIALLRTNWGVAWMQKWGERHAGLVKFLGYVGVFVGFAGMIFIVVTLLHALYKLILTPLAAPAVTPVIPGVSIPGSPFDFPLFETIIAIFFVIVVHEAAHGLVAAAHKLKIKSSGLFFLGPIPGAFVEPDEKALVKKSDMVQHSIFAAGPWSNAIFGFLFMGLLTLAGLGLSAIVVGQGVYVGGIVADSPAEMAGLPADVIFVELNGEAMDDLVDLQEGLDGASPGDVVVLGTDSEEYSVTLGAREEDETKPWVGINDLRTVSNLEQNYPFVNWVVNFILRVLFLSVILNFGIGSANLLPLGPVDGGRMFQLVSRKVFGKKRGDYVWAKVAVIFLVVLLILLLFPIFSALFPSFF